jgi:hypothetical protein
MPVIRAIDERNQVDQKALTHITEKLPYKSLEQSLDESNAGVPDVARVIGDILNYGCSESTKLRAAQLAIEFRSLGDKKNDNRIVFNLVGNNITLNNLIVQE